MTTPNGSASITLALVGFAAALPANLQPSTFILGLMFSGAGVVLRAGSEIQKSSEGIDGIKLSKIAAWVSGGFLSAPGVTLMYLIALGIGHFPANVPQLFFLIPISFYGQKGTIWLLQATTQITKGAAGAVFKGFPSLGSGTGDGK